MSRFPLLPTPFHTFRPNHNVLRQWVFVHARHAQKFAKSPASYSIMPLGLVPMQDSAGDAWIQVWLHHGPASAPLAFVGMHAGALRCCRRSRCLDVLVFGGSGGAAEAAGMHATAGHAFVRGERAFEELPARGGAQRDGDGEVVGVSEHHEVVWCA